MSDKRSVLDKLDDTIGAIERHRAVSAQEKGATVRKVNAAWAAVLESARDLRRKLKDEPRLRYLSIDRDELSISISFRAEQTGVKGELLELSRRHPEGKFPAVEAVWVRQPEKEDRRFTDAEEVVDLMVRFVARNLTRS